MGAARKLSRGHSPHMHAPTCNTHYLYKQDVRSLEKIQRKGARFFTGNFSYQHSVTAMLDDLNWPLLEHRRKNKRLTTFYKICNNSITVTLPNYVKTSNSRTRSHDWSYIQIQTNYSFLQCSIREWNNIFPDLLHAESVDIFSFMF